MQNATSFLEAPGLDCGYSKKNILVKNLHFTLRQGEVLGVLGPNGSGKTTLLRTLAKIVPPQRGEIVYFGKTPPEDLAKRVAFLPQNMEAPIGFTLREIVQMGRYPHQSSWGRWSSRDHSIIQGALEQMEITSLADQRGRSLSGGEKKRMFLAQVLAQSPDIFLLDEPLAHLDLHHQFKVIQLLRSLADQGASLVVTFHNLELAGYLCHHLLLLKGGGYSSWGPPREILTPGLIQEAFGVSLSIDFSRDLPKIQYVLE